MLKGDIDIGAAIYGLLTVGALLAAESAASETYGETVFGVVLALLVYWIAYSYAMLVRWRVREAEPLTLLSFFNAAASELPILMGATPPLIAVLLAWAVGASLNTAIVAALWTAAAAIVIIETLSGIRARLSRRELVIQTLVGAALGLMMLALRLELH